MEYRRAVVKNRLLRLLLAAGLILPAAGAAGVFLRAFIDLLQHAWFKPENLDLGEPILAFFAASASAALLWLAATSWLSWCLQAPSPGRRKTALAALGYSAALIIASLGISRFARSRFAESSGDLYEAADIPREPRERRGLLILSQGSSGPDYMVHEIVLGSPDVMDYSPESLEKLKAYIRRGAGLHLPEALRHLYGGHTIGMSADSLREALFLAHLNGDALARLLLLESLTRAPRGESSARFLDALSDESLYRIGPRAAAMLSAAYGHLGLKERSAYWLGVSRPETGGIPAGLLELPEKPLDGRIRGVLAGLGRVRAALYYHSDPAAPYSLGASSLVDSQLSDARGRFEFSGLPEGDYFLAFSYEPRRAAFGSNALSKCPMGAGGLPPCISFVANHRGDIRLSPERPRTDLGVLEPHFITR